MLNQENWNPYAHKNICTKMLITVLFMLASIRNNLMLINKWVDKQIIQWNAISNNEKKLHIYITT